MNTVYTLLIYKVPEILPLSLTLKARGKWYILVNFLIFNLLNTKKYNM